MLWILLTPNHEERDAFNRFMIQTLLPAQQCVQPSAGARVA